MPEVVLEWDYKASSWYIVLLQDISYGMDIEIERMSICLGLNMHIVVAIATCVQ